MLSQSSRKCFSNIVFVASGTVLGLLATLIAAAPAQAAQADLLLSPVGPGANASLGLYLAPAGDLNGDGLPDFAVGAPGAQGIVNGCGVVYIYFGGPALDAVPDLVLSGEVNGDQFGTSVSGCGDVNGDGWDDLVVGAPRNDFAFYNAGRAYLYFGGPALDNQPDLVIDGLGNNAFLGYTVAGAGDLDGSGDGNELIIGSPASLGADGRALVYFGGAALDATADLTLGAGIGGFFGWSVAGVGDFNADGWDDVIVGGNTLINVYLFAGGPAVDDQQDLVFTGGPGINRFGYGLNAAGDVNGDGYDDVIIGDMHNSFEGVFAGRAFVFFGGPGADGLAELVYYGTQERGIFGRTVAGAGDLNHDGYDDLIIGAPTPDTAGYGPGETFVFFGGDPAGTVQTTAVADLSFIGEVASDRLGSQVAIVGDQDGDGRADFLTGANLFDAGALTNAGKFYLYGVPNELPLALADSLTLIDDQPVAIAVLANDSDPDGTLLPASVTITAAPVHGLAAVDTLTGEVVYTPDPFFVGVDTLAYTVSDDEGGVSAPALVTIASPDGISPAPVALLAAIGSPGAVTVSWQGAPVDADSLEIWRAVWQDQDGLSAYPLYDDAPGSALPVRPADRAAAQADTAWTLVARVAAVETALVDSVAARGDYHYEIFVADAAANWSGPTATAPRALNYLLGDFAGFGDGVVDSTDAAVLAGDYGLTRLDGGFDPASDFGPTADGTLTGVPLTDGFVDFEDVMVLAMDYGTPAAPTSAGGDVELAWLHPAADVWSLNLVQEHASLKGLRLTLALPEGVTAQVAGGSLVAAQAAATFLASADTIDIALAVLGGGAALTGSGELLTFTLSDAVQLAPPVVLARATDNTDLTTILTGSPNEAPVAVADSVTLPDAQPIAINVLANDSDFDGTLVPASVMVVVAPLHGLAEVDTLTGAIVYTPDLDFSGADSLSYTVADNEGAVSLPAVVTITVPDTTAPAPLALLAAVGAPGTVTVSWQGASVDADSLEIWRAVWQDQDGLSAYPLYDDAPGSTQPVRPADRAEALADTAWTLVAHVAAGDTAFVDAVVDRGVYHYEAFVADAALNWSGPTATAPRTFNYLLGDFAAAGDGIVDAADAAALLADFGIGRDLPGFDAAADVGPTADGTFTGIPVTDGFIDFEDAMILAMTHGTPAAPISAGGDVDLAWLHTAPGVWTLGLEQAHASLKGLSVAMVLPEGAAVQVAGGDLTAAQLAPMFLASADTDTVTIALVALGGGAAIEGTGALLEFTVTGSALLPEVMVLARATDNTDLVTVVSGPPNEAPVAVADSVPLPDAQPFAIDVLANDSDFDGTLVPASVMVVVAPLHGLAEVDTLTGAIVYTPEAGFSGADSLSYTVADNEGAVSLPAIVTITVPDTTAPATVALLAAAGGPGAVTVSWQDVPADADSLEIWRAVWQDQDGLSAYPLYDDAPGSALPVRPADRTAAQADTAWTLVARVAAVETALVDSVAARGDYHYEIFAADAAANWSGPTTTAPRALNYVLGDFAGLGDGIVDSTDAAVLTADYGLVQLDGGFDPASDFGPTADGTLTGVPLTDGAIDFEDVMVLAMDYGTPAAPASAGGDVELVWLHPAADVWSLNLVQEHASLKGLRLTLALPAGVTAQIAGGSLAAAQAAPMFLADAGTDTLDIALAVLGGGAALTGSGELLTFTLSDAVQLAAPAVLARATDNTNLTTTMSGPPNEAPVALADSVTLPDAQPIAIDVLANDSDFDGTLVPATVSIVTPPLHGLAEVDTLTGAIVYTPEPGFAGDDSLSYTVADDEGAVSLPAVVTITVPDTTAPAAVALLSAFGTPGAVTVSWQDVPADADSLEIWRAVWQDQDGLSAYPLYDDAAGSALPVRPADRAAAQADTAWTLVVRLAAAETALVDSLTTRGVYQYEIFAGDAAANYGPPTVLSPRTFNYRLGDIAGFGDGLVDTADVAVLLADYGVDRGQPGFDAFADVGPTADGTFTGIPVTDGAVDFEDVMIVAMTHGTPAAPAASGGAVQLVWRRPAPGVWTLGLEQAHASLKGLRLGLALPAGVTAQVSGGALVAAQVAPMFLANADSDTLDIALAVLGGGAALAGNGELLVITLSEAVDLAQPVVTARATDNTDLPTAFAQVSGVPGAGVVAFGLDQNSPNPFNPQTTIRFSLPEGGRTRLAVFDIRGRLVTKLVDGDLPAGAHAVVWDGRDGRGAPMGSGVYLYRLEARGQVTSRRMTLVK